MSPPKEFDVYRLTRSEHMRRELLAIRALVALDQKKSPAQSQGLSDPGREGIARPGHAASSPGEVYPLDVSEAARIHAQVWAHSANRSPDAPGSTIAHDAERA